MAIVAGDGLALRNRTSSRRTASDDKIDRVDHVRRDVRVERRPKIFPLQNPFLLGQRMP
jgi:hypothetical protein